MRGIILSIQNLVSNNHISAQLKNDLAVKERQNLLLTQQLTYVKSTDYIEKVARNKLGLTKANEHLVLEPTPVISPKFQKISPEKKSWQKWVELFLKN